MLINEFGGFLKLWKSSWWDNSDKNLRSKGMSLGCWIIVVIGCLLSDYIFNTRESLVFLWSPYYLSALSLYQERI